MKIVIKRCGKFESGKSACWIALKDKDGYYHDIHGNGCRSKDIVFPGTMDYYDNRHRRIEYLKKEGHTV